MAFRILVVDDSPAMRSYVRRIAAMSGLAVSEVVEAGDGMEAMERLRSTWVDVVVTDINMPRMDGEAFVSAMEQDEFLRLIPVVVVSTDATGPRIERMLSLGAKGYLRKPFAPERLRDELERVLGVASECR